MRVSVRKLATLVTTLLVSAVVALPAHAGGRPHWKLDRILQEALAKPPKTTRVIIQVRPGSEDALKLKLQGHGDVIEAEHASIDALTATIHGEDLAALAGDPDVLGMSIDAWVTSLGRFSQSTTSRASAPDLLRATLGLTDPKFSVITGAGIAIAIVDSGIYPNRDLAPSIVGFWDFTRGGISTRAFDDYGHGTHVAGLIASDGKESNGQYKGIAPGALLYGFKVLDANGRGRTSDVVAAIDFIVDSKIRGTFSVDVINLSLGHPIFEPASTDPLVKAIERAVRYGIIVVTAAGNNGLDSTGVAGYAGINSPGNAPSALTVGAVDTNGTVLHSDDRVAYFSSRGPTWFDGFAKPDIVAAGVSLTSDAAHDSTLYGTYPQLKAPASNGNTNYATLSGTSMAAAVATGVVALTLDASRQANTTAAWGFHSKPAPALTPNAVKAVLEYSALPVVDGTGKPYDPLTQGTGEVNAPGAVLMAQNVNTAAKENTSWGGPVEPITTIGGETLAWSQALIWDENIVWGTNIVWSNSYLWDENIVWGTIADENIVWGTAADENIVWGTYYSCDPASDPACENIVWGTNIVWGANIVWASNIVWGNRVVGLMDGENIVWGTSEGLTEENIVWGTSADGENIVWGTKRRR